MTTASTKIYSVSEVTDQIKQHLESRFFQVCIKGEITNFKKQSSGHLYFNLKDDFAQISCVLFKNAALKLAREPKAGDKVMLKGALTVYAPRGGYQIIATELSFEGLGDLLLMLHELKNKYQSLGYFDMGRKKPLPKYPKTIGVVTSPTGAVIQDILNVLKRRFKGFHLILNPVKVQGEGAETEIAKAIDEFNTHNLVDVMIIGRGGGSLEDLWAFNHEKVIEAIYRSKIPVISAVGHETDFSLSDFVADVRAPTPSSAAEIVIKEKSEQLEFLQKAKQTAFYCLTQSIKQHKLKLKAITSQKIFFHEDALMAPFFQKQDDIEQKLNDSILKILERRMMKLDAYHKTLSSLRPEKQIKNYREKLSFYLKRLDDGIFKQLLLKSRGMKSIADLTLSLSPTTILKKGYCIPFAENSASVIISAKQPKLEQGLALRFHDGSIQVKVTKEF